MTYLFFFSIGPVQSFIAQARKTHDLFSGSKLLSELSKEGIETAKKLGCSIIMPDVSVGTDKVPNRFVARIETAKEGDLKKFGSKVEQAVRGKFKSHIPDDIKHLEPVSRQIETHLDIHWLFIPVNGGYKSAYNKGSNRMGSIKGIRKFKQITDVGERGRKCSIDGERNVVVYRETERDRGSVAETKLFVNIKDVRIEDKNSEKEIEIWKLQPGEGLSAVSYLKRCFEEEPHLFPSTTGISLLHIKETFKLEYEVYEEKVKNLLGHSDDQLFYEENLKTSFLEKLPLTNGKDIADISKSLATALKILKEKIEKAHTEHLKFLKYYAVISFDGDNMGKWFSGENLEGELDLDNFHRALSKQLSAFAKEASGYLHKNKYTGMTVYAGEDFLGFINLMHLFPVLEELKCIWDRKVHIPLSTTFSFKEEKKMTFSAGITIAHYKQPLSVVLQNLRNAVKKAKKEPKNAFTFMAMKHSGSAVQCTYSFDSEALFYLGEIRNCLKKEFSSAFIMKFISILMPLGEKIPVSIARPELEHAVKRSNKMKQATGETEDDFKARRKKANEVMITAVNGLMELDVQNSTILSGGNFIQALSLCDFIERKIN